MTRLPQPAWYLTMRSDAELGIRPFEADAPLLRAAARVEFPVCRIYRFSAPLVVLGFGSRPEAELQLEACRGDGIPLFRRPGGGCSVVIDPGGVIVSVAYRAPGFADNQGHFLRISTWLIAALERVGVEQVQMAGGSDLVIDNYKFAGASIRRTGGWLYYSACLLVDSNVDLIDRYLKHPPREPDYRRGRPHRRFVRPLADHPGGWTSGMLEPALRTELDPSRLGGPGRPERLGEPRPPR